MKRRVLIGALSLVLAVLVGGAIFFFVSNSRAGVESPSYRILEQAGEFELREYPDLVLATTPMNDGGNGDGSFGRLFRYISGANARNERIAMTSPVLMDRRSDSASMSFILPAEKASNAPEGAGQVRLDRFPGGRYAALRFTSDGRDRSAEGAALERIRQALNARGLTPSGDPLMAYYDPPWTPTPLRRNEILLRVATP